MNGYGYTPAGARSRHNRVAGSSYVHFRNLSQGNACRSYMSDVKLRIKTQGTLLYHPDVMIVCKENEPCILVEVLSPGTRSRDLREKRLAYKSLPSAQTYLIVETERLVVSHSSRSADGHWRQEDLNGDGDISLPCLSGTLSLP